MKKSLIAVVEKLAQNSPAVLSPEAPGIVFANGEKLCRISVMVDLLRMGVVQVDGPQRWTLRRQAVRPEA